MFHREPILQTVKVLITEVTFFEDDVDKIEAKKRGHMHIDDIIDNPELFCQPAIVLMHASSRFTGEDVHRILEQKMPEEMPRRVNIIPNNSPLEGF